MALKAGFSTLVVLKPIEVAIGFLGIVGDGHGAVVDGEDRLALGEVGHEVAVREHDALGHVTDQRSRGFVLIGRIVEMDVGTAHFTVVLATGAASHKAVAKIDQAAQKKGLTKTDDYLDQWNWSEKKERPGDPEEVAEYVKNELEEKL